MKSIQTLPWASNDKTPIFRAYIEQMLSAQELNKEERYHLLLERLSNTLRYSKEHVEFYKTRFLSLNPDFLTLPEFENLPVLTKSDVRNHLSELISDEFKSNQAPNRMFEFNTSGSTGTPMRVFRGARNISFVRAISLYYHIFANRDFSLSNVSVITSKENQFNAGKWAPCMNTGPGYIIKIDESSEFIFDKLLELKPNYIQTHPSTLKRLIDISLEKKSILRTN